MRCNMDKLGFVRAGESTETKDGVERVGQAKAGRRKVGEAMLGRLRDVLCAG